MEEQERKVGKGWQVVPSSLVLRGRGEGWLGREI